MGKEIVLPWTCRTSDNIKLALAIIGLVGFPLASFFSIYYGLQEKDFVKAELLALSFVVNLLASTLIWTAAYLLWGLKEALPYFTCKQPNRKEDSQ